MSPYEDIANTSHKRISKVRWVTSFSIMLPLVIVWGLFLNGNLQSYRVISASMSPTLEVGDCVVMKHQEKYDDLSNHIIAFKDPKGDDDALTKRVIAEGPATVQLNFGYIYLNSRKEPLPGDKIEYVQNGRWEVPKGSVFVIGDNRNDSYDSIDYGPIPRSSILGVIAYRYYPLSRSGWIY